jgi:cell division protein FtsX
VTAEDRHSGDEYDGDPGGGEMLRPEITVLGDEALVQAAEMSVRIRDDVARALQGPAEESEEEARALEKLVAGLGGTLVPVHPGSDDPLLRRHFTVRVEDAETVGRVAEELRKADAVEAVLTKPSAELP